MAGTLDAVLFDAFGTLFAPISAGSPAAHLRRILASDGVSVPAERAERATLAEVELYRAKFPHIRDGTRTAATRERGKRLGAGGA